MTSVFIKVCGITRASDARHAVQQGATALGFVLWPKSPRAITVDRAAEIIAELPSHVVSVGVFVNESIDGIRVANNWTDATCDPATPATHSTWGQLKVLYR